MEQKNFTVYVDGKTCRGEVLHLRYTLLKAPRESGARYGVEVFAQGDGFCQTARAEDLTSSREKALALLELLKRNAVTPVALADVVQDWL